MTIAATGALLRVQQALVTHFAEFSAGSTGLVTTLHDFGLALPSPLPPLLLYDEPPAGLHTYYRIGNAAIDYEAGNAATLWSIDQDLEVYSDPVRGRAQVLALADVLERAFLPTDGAEMNFDRDNLRYIDAHGNSAVAPIRVVDMVPTGTTIGFSSGGLTYQAIVTYNLIVARID